MKKLEVNGKEICDQAKVNDEIKFFLRKPLNFIRVNRSQIFLTFCTL